MRKKNETRGYERMEMVEESGGIQRRPWSDFLYQHIDQRHNRQITWPTLVLQ